MSIDSGVIVNAHILTDLGRSLKSRLIKWDKKRGSPAKNCLKRSKQGEFLMILFFNIRNWGMFPVRTFSMEHVRTCAHHGSIELMLVSFERS